MNLRRRMLIGSGVAAAVVTLACATPSTDNGHTPDGSTPQTQENPVIVDGTFKVPEQMKPGKYESVVPADSFGCYFARLRDTTGGPNSIISNDLGSPQEQVRVEIRESDNYFETSGCGQWQPE